LLEASNENNASNRAAISLEAAATPSTTTSSTVPTSDMIAMKPVTQEGITKEELMKFYTLVELKSFLSSTFSVNSKARRKADVAISILECIENPSIIINKRK